MALFIAAVIAFVVGVFDYSAMRKAVHDSTSSPWAYNTARAKFGMEFVDVGLAGSPVVPAPQQLVSGGQMSSITGMAKVKIATVLDQSSNIEVPMLDHAELLKLRQRYVTKMGDYPMEREDVTDGLQALGRLGPCSFC
eukprot:2877079-Amphidinium_carterae.1